MDPQRPHLRSTEAERVAAWLAGTYSNRDQAMADPVWYVPVTLWYVRLPSLFDQGIGFFTEQVNQHTPQQYYRSRVVQVLEDPLRLESHKLRHPSAWAGAAQDPVKLAQLSPVDLELLVDCTLTLTDHGDHFRGQMSPGHPCRLNPGDAVAIEICFDLYPNRFLTLDRGIEIATGKQTWGSRSGPYDYRKLT